MHIIPAEVETDLNKMLTLSMFKFSFEAVGIKGILTCKVI